MPSLPSADHSSTDPIRVVGITGSLRRGSSTTAAVRIALEGAAAAGAAVELIDLREYKLMFAGNDQDDSHPTDVEKLRETVKKADGILLGTPEYHGSFSGVLKNALELVSLDEFEGKMIGLVGVSAGRMGGLDALSSLRNVARAVHAWVVPEQVSVPKVSTAFDASGQPVDAITLKRLHHLGRRVTQFARLHRHGRAHDFLTTEIGTENTGA